MDKCPFCGFVETWRFNHDQGLDLNFACETALRDSDIWIRGSPCYETELATLKSQLENMTIQRDKWMEEVLNLRGVSTNPDMVMVRREDLLEETSIINGLMTYAVEFQGADLPYHNRLKAALEEK